MGATLPLTLNPPDVLLCHTHPRHSSEESLWHETLQGLRKSQSLPAATEAPSHLAHSPLAMVDSLLVLEHSRCTPTPWPLHLLWLEHSLSCGYMGPTSPPSSLFSNVISPATSSGTILLTITCPVCTNMHTHHESKTLPSNLQFTYLFCYYPPPYTAVPAM